MKHNSYKDLYFAGMSCMEIWNSHMDETEISCRSSNQMVSTERRTNHELAYDCVYIYCNWFRGMWAPCSHHRILG